ncbi:MAG TPA: hypothetical protein VK928_02895 [Longimicrobiales bacterium]|nr:hypothetical protein [Longimicrobiales bacterium]
MKPDRRRPEDPEWEQHEDDINWTAGVGRPAGVYWIDGRSVIAAHGSPAEDHLVDQGAVLVATLLFEPDPRERVHRRGRVERVRAADAARDMLTASAN